MQRWLQPPRAKMSVRRRRLSLVKLSAGRLSHTPSKCLHANCTIHQLSYLYFCKLSYPDVKMSACSWQYTLPNLSACRFRHNLATLAKLCAGRWGHIPAKLSSSGSHILQPSCLHAGEGSCQGRSVLAGWTTDLEKLYICRCRHTLTVCIQVQGY